MLAKENILFIILSVLSIITGAVFGLLDVFGFVDGRHAISLSLLIAGIVLIYFTLITVFILNFSQKKQARIAFIIAPILCGTTFFLMNLNLIQSLIVTATYLLFIYHVYFASRQRSQLFIRFSPKEIFFPILKKSFTYLLVILALSAYFQSQKLVQQHNLASPRIVKVVAKPFILIINKQFSNELQRQFKSVPLTKNQKEIATRMMLNQTLESMSDERTGDVYGIPLKAIPVQKTIVDPNGKVDVTPVVDTLLPTIVDEINQRINEYAFFTPIAIALFISVFLQPLLYPIQLLESVLTLAIFKLLFAIKFIRMSTEERQVETIKL